MQIPSNYISIPSFPGYYVDESGHIIKVYENGYKHILSTNSKFAVTLFKDGKRYCKSAIALWREALYGKTTKMGGYTKAVSARNTKTGPLKWVKYDSLTEASKATGVPVSRISKLINGHGYSAYGWVFRSEV